MSAAETPPASDPTPPVPPAMALTRRLFEAVIGLFIGASVGGIVGTITLVLVAIVLGWINVGQIDIVLALILGMAGAILGGAYGGLFGLMHGALVGPVWGLFAGRHSYSPKVPRAKLIIPLSCLASVIVLAWVLWSIQAASPPHPSEVESMTVVFRAKQPGGSFAVPPEHIPKLLTALAPSARDWYAKKWVGADQLKITYKDGRTVTIDLYQTRARWGAFSVHPDDRPRNWGFVPNYFRGGSDKAMADAVQAAYEESKLGNQ